MLVWTLVIIVVLVAIVVAMQPANFSVSRDILIDAARNDIFQQVNNLKKWESWSPWAKLDQDAKSEFEGPEEGIGALMRWDGNKNVGQGSMEIIESMPPEFIKFQLVFLKPMQGTSYATFRFDAENSKTRVTWTMTGHNNYIAKAVGLVMNCDKMMGGYFETGLKNLQMLVEQREIANG